jgi:two-component system, NarL family, invasion response regulator UvrY
VKILIADDHPLIRKKFIELIKEDFPNASVTEAFSGIKALQMMQDQTWSLVIMDISMPGKNGIEVLKLARQLSVETPVLIMSLNNNYLYASKAMKAGASGYLSKEYSAEELTTAINQIMSGKKFFSKGVSSFVGIMLRSDKISKIKPFQAN